MKTFPHRVVLSLSPSLLNGLRPTLPLEASVQQVLEVIGSLHEPLRVELTKRDVEMFRPGSPALEWRVEKDENRDARLAVAVIHEREALAECAGGIFEYARPFRWAIDGHRSCETADEIAKMLADHLATSILCPKNPLDP